MTHEIRQHIRRPATPEEKARHQQIRQEIDDELPDLKQWARAAAADHKERIAVGTVFDADEAPIVKAIDEYAAKHFLQNRSAVVREALASHGVGHLPGLFGADAGVLAGVEEPLRSSHLLPLLAGENVTTSFVVPTVASCIDIVVHAATDSHGRRRVREIVAVPGRVEGDVVEVAGLFRSTGGKLLRDNGFPPHAERFADQGFDLGAILAPTTDGY